MSINLVEICRLKYPGMIEAGLISFYQPENDILIQFWNVPNIPQPLESDLIALASQYETEYQTNIVKLQFEQAIEDLLNKTAQQRSYTNSIFCASYVASSNVAWSNEAKAFVAWRDQIYQLAIQMQTDVQNGTIPLPNMSDYINSLPLITWP